MYKTDARIYTTADGSEVVEEHDPRAALLLAAEGQEIPDAVAERLGLGGKKRAQPESVVVQSIAADPPKEESQDPPQDAEAKAVAAPSENKARTMRAAKADEGK